MAAFRSVPRPGTELLPGAGGQNVPGGVEGGAPLGSWSSGACATPGPASLLGTLVLGFARGQVLSKRTAGWTHTHLNTPPCALPASSSPASLAALPTA